MTATISRQQARADLQTGIGEIDSCPLGERLRLVYGETPHVQVVTGEFQGIELRSTGEVFVWLQKDDDGTDLLNVLAVPASMIIRELTERLR